GFERAMQDAGWTTRIGVRHKLRATRAFVVGTDIEIARNEIDLLPVVMHKRLRRERTGLKPQQPRPVSPLGCLIERACQDLLLDALRIALRRVPVACGHIDLMEFPVLLVDCHGPLTRQRVGNWRVRRPANRCRACDRSSACSGPSRMCGSYGLSSRNSPP